MQDVQTKPETICEAVGVFTSEDDLQNAIDDLSFSGFDSSALSVLGEFPEDKQEEFQNKTVRDFEEDPSAPRATFVPKEALGNLEGVLIGIPIYLAVVTVMTAVIATGGSAMTAVFSSLVAGAFAGVAGFLFARRFHKSRQDKIDQQLAKGGLILWVDTHNAEQEKQAIRILKENEAFDVHLFKMPIPGTSSSSI